MNTRINTQANAVGSGRPATAGTTLTLKEAAKEAAKEAKGLEIYEKALRGEIGKTLSVQAFHSRNLSLSRDGDHLECIFPSLQAKQPPELCSKSLQFAVNMHHLSAFYA